MYILLDYHLSSQFFVNIFSNTDGFMKWWLWVILLYERHIFKPQSKEISAKKNNTVKDTTHTVPSLLWSGLSLRFQVAG